MAFRSVSPMSESLRKGLIEGEQAGMRYAICLPRQTLAASSGASLGQQVGSSLELKDYREYQPGDDLRHIDWGAYARSDQLSVKLYREEVCPHADILIDITRSMALTESVKDRATAGLAAFFAAAAGNTGFSHRAWMLGERVQPLPNGHMAPGHWTEMALTECASPAEGLLHGPPEWRLRGVRILVSDLLWECEPLPVVRQLADRASVVVVVQVLAQADVDPPEPGNYRLVDSETNEIREIYIDATVAQRYREGLARHQQNWSDACRQVGAVFSVVVAEEILEDWSLDDLVQSEVLAVK